MRTNDDPEVGGSIVADGIRTNYYDVGKGEGTPLLLLHGSGSRTCAA